MEGAMRVSVVATGIDASEAHETPLPRRSLAQPLKQPEAVEVDTPAVAEEPVAAARRSLSRRCSSRMDAQRAAAEDQMEDIFEDDDAGDEVPRPAYQPRVEEFVACRRSEAMTSEESLSPRAPRASGTGTPSPEALQRLQAAVGKAPVQPAPRRPERPGPAMSAPQPAFQRRPSARFGINSLINRMTGHGHHMGIEPPAPGTAAPQVQSAAAHQPALARAG